MASFILTIFTSTFSTLVNPLLVTVCVCAKLCSLVPLLIHWNFPLLEIPGPTPASWLQFWKPKRKYDHIHGYYGKIVRIGARHISLCDAHTFRTLKRLCDIDQLSHSSAQNSGIYPLFTIGIGQRKTTDEVATIFDLDERLTTTLTYAIIQSITQDVLIKSRLRREIDSVTKDIPLKQFIANTDLPNMPYLQACILEGLRTHFHLVTHSERIVLLSDCMIYGYGIPSGTTVDFNFEAALRLPCFGEDAQTFSPDRWHTLEITEKPEMLEALERILTDENSSTSLFSSAIGYLVMRVLRDVDQNGELWDI